MKSVFIALVFALVTKFSLAQTVIVTPTEHSMSLGSHPALSVQINGVDADDALEDFESYWKSNGARGDVKNDELKATEYAPKELKPSVFTVYAKAVEEKNSSVIYLWAYDGTDYVSQSHPAFAHFQKHVKAFGISENRKPYEKQLKEAERALEKSVDARQSLERQRSGWMKDIEDCNKTIQSTQSKLKDSESDLSKNVEAIRDLERDRDKLKKQIDAVQ